MNILTILILLASIQIEPAVVDCKIIYTTFDSKTVSCKIDKESLVTQFSNDEWPKEWKDSTQSGDVVKLLVSEKEMIPMLSCAARERLMREKLSKRKSEFKLPLQLPMDKDCQ